MRFHVLGLGPIGNLIAFHLRRTLSPNHEVVLMFKDQGAARRARKGEIEVENEGVVSRVSGFRTDFTNDYSDLVYNMVFNKRGRLRLPSREDRMDSDFTAPEEKSGRHSTIESLIIACKAYSTLPVLKQIKHRIRPESTIVLCQNGNLAVHELLCESIFPNPSDRPNIVLVSNNHGAWLKKPPFHIVHAGVGSLRFGIVPDGRRDFEASLSNNDPLPSPRKLNLDDIAQEENDPMRARYLSLRNTIAVMQGLRDLHPSWDSFSSLQTTMRQKVVVNSVINPITMLLQCRNGDLFGNAAVDRLTARICAEAANVFMAEAKAQMGEYPDSSVPVRIPEQLKAQQLVDECRRVARMTAGNISSMLADLRKGNPNTEIEYLNGYLMNLGRRYGVLMPVNASLLDLVKLRSSLPLNSKL